MIRASVSSMNTVVIMTYLPVSSKSVTTGGTGSSASLPRASMNVPAAPS